MHLNGTHSSRFGFTGRVLQCGLCFKVICQPCRKMCSSLSTEKLLNSFPMFGHPGISALEYAGCLEATRERNTSATSESLKHVSTASMRDENAASPTTAEVEPTGSDFSPPVQSIDEFGCQHRRRGTFLNHTPRDFEMQSSKTVEVYRPSRVSENYSRPRTSYQANSINTSHASASQHAYSSSTGSYTIEKRMTVDPSAPAELDSKEVEWSPSIDVYRPSDDSNRRSVSVPVTRIMTYQPRSIISTGQQACEVSVRNTSAPSHRPQEKKRQRRQTPFRIGSPTLRNAARHAPLEPWVAEHRRRGTNDTISDLQSQTDADIAEEMGTFGVIQRYFDSQTGGPVSSPETLCHAYSPSTLDFPLPAALEPPLEKPSKKPVAIFPIDELELPSEPPPAVPDRSPKRLTNPSFPLHTKSTMSMDSEFAFAAEGQYSPYEKKDYDLHVPKKRGPKCHDVRQANRAGSSNVGRLAPPILSHAALTASSDLGLNDLSYYLKHTGPSTDFQPTSRQIKKNGMKIFKVKQRKSLAARVGSVEGSPLKVRKQTPVPACAREMTTSSGARHLKIIVPTETLSNHQTISLPVSRSGLQRRSRHVSITFTEEMLNPLASPEIERMLSSVDTASRSFSDPIPMAPRSPKRPPKSPKLVPVKDHPLASREEQTRARKLRDLQRIKRQPLSTYTQTEHHSDTIGGALPTPAHTPEPAHDSSFDSIHEDEGDDEKDTAQKLLMLQERVVSLQRQNTELTEALAKIVGLELKEGNLNSEHVLRTFRKVMFFEDAELRTRAK